MAEIIIGTGAAVPDYVLDNDGVAEMVETDDAWIRERTGILQRHIAKEETADSLAEEAACRAMADAGIAPERIDLIVVATTTARVRMPCVACRVQEKIGAKQAVCFDLNAACTGFVLAYQTATAYLKAGIYRTALVIGSDCMSQVIDWGDRSTCIYPFHRTGRWTRSKTCCNHYCTGSRNYCWYPGSENTSVYGRRYP